MLTSAFPGGGDTDDGETPAYFRAVAVDFDGTLADGQVMSGVLTALAEARARQIKVILVTGRIMSAV
jgi:hydroxymethylpyrimidine pyrophosphatase-like HAD family hydrolase